MKRFKFDRRIYWIKGHWEWGWLGNGWNVFRLGKVRIWL